MIYYSICFNLLQNLILLNKDNVSIICDPTTKIYENITCEVELYPVNPYATVIAEYPDELIRDGYFLSTNPFKFYKYFKKLGNFTFTVSVTSKITTKKTFWVNVVFGK
jgi:hypothetical protein